MSEDRIRELEAEIARLNRIIEEKKVDIAADLILRKPGTQFGGIVNSYISDPKSGFVASNHEMFEIHGEWLRGLQKGWRYHIHAMGPDMEQMQIQIVMEDE